ncbi:MAG: Crp/Fnr family transcriptional regulator [Prochloraceae cyanobacterium]
MSQELPRPANLILSSLPEEEYQQLSPYLYPVSLPLGTTLYDAGDKIETVYFPNETVISLIAILEEGEIAETALIGKFGIIGLPAILGTGYNTEKTIVQVADNLMKMSASVLKTQFLKGGELQRYILLYTEYRMIEINRQSVCNTYHTIEQRLARWLLRIQDLVGSQELFLTQDFIAKMLGVNRSSVTIIAGILQRAGMISYSRGKVTILDRVALEDTTCQCYFFLKQEYERVLESQFK